MVVVELPIKTVAGLNAREHWRKRANRVRLERHSARMSLANAAFRQHLPAMVTLVRISSGKLDDDNLQGAFKAIRDGVADAYGVPDNDPRIAWKYAQERCERGRYGVRIIVESA